MMSSLRKFDNLRIFQIQFCSGQSHMRDMLIDFSKGKFSRYLKWLMTSKIFIYPFELFFNAFPLIYQETLMIQQIVARLKIEYRTISEDIDEIQLKLPKNEFHSLLNLVEILGEMTKFPVKITDENIEKSSKNILSEIIHRQREICLEKNDTHRARIRKKNQRKRILEYERRK